MKRAVYTNSLVDPHQDNQGSDLSCNPAAETECLYSKRIVGSYSMTGGMRVRSGGVERVGAQSKVGEYQVGFFRAVNRLEQQEEVPENPPPTPDNNNVPPPPDTPPAPPSAFAITWAAFSSFFLSLIPEQQNVL
ncbi:hypothetical protein J6590_010330 [Homalodisca vitripennis]|nr:hypothetical protein J6590_010330 [Homalodisca vitripennis]